VPPARRFASVEDLIRRTGVRRDELTVLAEIGALNSLGYDRRAALWQIERAIRPSGELFEEDERRPVTGRNAVRAELVGPRHRRGEARSLEPGARSPARVPCPP
jgi:DNA polymerase III alpha subunit